MKLKFYISVLFTFITFGVLAQNTELSATISKNKLGVNQRLRVDFTINKQGGDDFKAPDFKDFKVIGGPSQSVSQSWINGVVSFKQSYSYIIQPKRKGQLTIESASVTMGGNTIVSKPLKVTVTKAVDIPKDPNNPDYIAEQNVHLVTYVSNSNPYVGEAIYLEYRIYIKNVEASLAGDMEKPKYEGFWNQEIDITSLKGEKGTYNGEEYTYAVLQKSVLIPTKSGKLYIEPLTTDLIVRVPTRRRDFFGNILTQNTRKSFSSIRKLINVQSLPIDNKPKSFNGAVGDFDYSVKLSKNQLKANESSQIKVTIAGKGNLKLFEIPKIEAPTELEVYQPERKEKARVTVNGLKGSITNTYTVVPQYRGKYKIPSTEFSYFNPKDKRYHTIISKDIIVDVIEGKKLPENRATAKQQNVIPAGNEYHYIATSTNFQPKEKQPFFNSIGYYLMLLLPLLAIPFGIFIKKKNDAKKGNIKGIKIRNADKLAKKYLSEAKINIENKESFYESLERALHNYLKAKLGVETSEISVDKITELLQDKNVNSETISSFINVLNDCNFARYTPSTDVQMQSGYQKAKAVITALDKQL